MKLYNNKYFIIIILIFLNSCLNYQTDLNSLEKIKVNSMNDIKKGESCSHNLFGGFTIPWIGETAIKIRGDQSVISAIKNANIQSIYAIDKYTRNYFIYSKRCTVVFGK
jgi:hypothetical protein